jgi:amino acid adenylation domain-containing protein
MDEIQARLSRLSPARRVLLQQLLGAAGRRAPQPTIPRYAGERAPLSFTQQRLWFLEQLEPGTALYNVPLALRLEGTLNAEALERVLDEVVRRHHVLRTRFAAGPDAPVQEVVPAGGFELPVIDLRRGGRDRRRASAARCLAQEAERPFDLERGPLFRAVLLRLDAEEHVLALTFHHAVVDGWSVSVLFREMEALYQAFARGEPSPLHPLAVQYTDYAAWQREQLAGEALDREVEWWRARLEAVPPELGLCADHLRSEAAAPAGARHAFALPPATAAAVRALASGEGATPFIVLLAAFKAMLHRRTGEAHLAVGTPAANRSPDEMADLIGLFANTLVLHTDVSGDPSFRALLARVREVTLSAFEHQELPFDRLVEALSPERSLRRNPLFQVMFALDEQDERVLRLPGVRAEPLEAERTTAKFDLTLAVSRRGDELRAVLEYSTELFDAATVERMAAHYQRLLEGALADPGLQLSRLPLLEEAERERLLVEWTGARAPYPDRCIHSLFETQARRTPDRVAVRMEDDALTYAELDARANQLAHALGALGVGPETRVALCVERAPEMIVALLGVLKAGGAYVPLDPEYPAERLAYLLRDSRAAVLLTQERLAARLPAHGAALLCLDRDWDERVAVHPDTPPDSGVRPENLAYVIYTSGSTGLPKGVLVEHRQLVDYTHSAIRRYAVTAADRVLQFVSLSFDACAEEIYPALLSGAELVLRTERMMDGMPLFLATCARWGITVLDLPTAYWHELVQELEETGAHLPPSVRLVLIGGERALPERLSEWQRRVGTRAQLMNAYGPTEATVLATVADLTRTEPVPLRPGEPLPPVAIGRPRVNTRAYVLDGRGGLLPAGARGELFLAGGGVARGYLGRASLTAERFLPDPFASEPGARMYRTGDLVRWRGDGELEFHGRADEQVKVRGYRVEPGEIEAVLRRQPGVRDAVVLAREDEPGRVRLVAWVVPADGAPGADVVAGLRDRLRADLPEYMVPAALVPLQALPLTAAGKLDRRALPAPAADDHQAYIAPRTATEKALARIWAELLGTARVGAHDNFFHLGGHSLLATRLVSRIRAELSAEVPVRLLFTSPTLAELARHLETGAGAGAIAEAPIPAVSGDRGLPLSFGQQRLWFLEQVAPVVWLYNLPVAVRLSRRLDADALRRGLEGLVARHESLRTTFAVEGDAPVQRIHPPGPVALPVREVGGADAERRERRVQRLLAAEARRPFDLARGPLFRAALFRLADDEHALLLCMHHVVSDGWSVSILLRDLAALYAAEVAGAPARLPAPALRYADFAAWQQGQFGGEALARQAAFWTEELRGAPPGMELPADRPRRDAASGRGHVVSFDLASETADALRMLARREGATPFMALLSAFHLLLSRYSGHDDVVVGTPVAGRTRPELDGVVGFFVNTLPLRADLSGDPPFTALLARVREATLRAFAHQDLPFEQIVDALGVPRDGARTPLVQALFVFNEAAPPAAPAGLDAEWITVHTGAARFDLTLTVQDRGGDGLGAIVTCTRERFAAATAERIAGHFRALLDAIVAEPAVAVSRYPLLGAGERLALEAWNRNDVDAAPAAAPTVVERFEEWARTSADRAAVRCEDRVITYSALAAMAARISADLRARGMGTESRVGVCMERGMEIVAALLGVMKAGAAYVPVDPSAPPRRIAAVLRDAEVCAVLADARSAPALAECEANIIVPGEVNAGTGPGETGGEATPGTHDRRGAIPGEALAYVIYTSGSTGEPKGVGIEHRQLAHYVDGVTRRLELEPGSSYAMVSTFAADLGHTCLFPALCTGGTLHVISRERAADAEAFTAYLRRHQVEVLKITPSHLAALLSSGRPADALPRRRLVLGGEASRSEWVEAVRALAPGLAVFNHYGPTETTVGTLTHRVDAPVETLSGTMPLGRPLPNARTYVLDPWLRPVPVGVPGELYVAGGGVARGYLGRPAATAAVFLPDPFADAPGGRMYRTGDRVRRLPCGSIEFLGRTDDQVKVRGYRVEPGEVAAALRLHPAVRDAVVVVHRDGGEARLAAYVVGAGTEAPGADELREHLRAQLTEAMLPGCYVAIPALPLTANGKVDRRALPPPAWSDEAPRRSAPPQTPVQEVVAGVWAELLGADEVGVDDDFFALGGHSLLATRAISRVRQALGVDVPVRALFDAPVLAAFAARVEAMRRSSSPRQEAPLVPVGRQGPLPLSFAQQRLWFIEQVEPAGSLYHMPAVLRLRGALDAAALGRALDGLVARHEALRTSFEASDGEPMQVVHPHAPFAVAMHDLRSLPPEMRAEEMSRLAGTISEEPFDLSAAPLFRAALVCIESDEHVLLLCMHHIVSDGWSVGVLFREMGALYAAAQTKAALPALTVQYADYAVWQRRQLNELAMAFEGEWWRGRLSGAPAVLELPADRPRPHVRGTAGASLQAELPPPLAAALRDLARREGATAYMVLLSAFYALLSRYAGQTDLVVGTPVAGRTRSELDGVVGFFINTLPLRADLSGDPSFRTLLARVREVTLSAFEHQELPFDRLVEALRPERSLSVTPVFQVMFAMSDGLTTAPSLPGLEVSVGGMDGTTAKFDLTLRISRRDDELHAVLEYSTELFDAATVKRMAAHYQRLLQGAAANPALPISRYELFDDEERRALEAWNHTGAYAAPAAAPTVVERFEEWARTSADRAAVRCEDRVITYSALAAMAARIAADLRTRGVGTESRVGVCMDRGVEIVAALLGVMKAGAAYVPVDPSAPPRRIAAVLRDAGVCAVLADAGSAPGLAECGGEIIVIGGMDAEEAACAAEAAAAPAGNRHRSDAPAGEVLAYVIYTSGSTGEPKGVGIEHRQLAHYVDGVTRRLELEPGSSYAMVSTFAADLGHTCLFPALCTGGTLHVISRERAADAEAFTAYLRRHQVEVLKITPSHLAALLSSGRPADALPRRRLVLGGEASRSEWVEAVRALAPGLAVFNHYGPTETTVGTLTHRVDAPVETLSGTMPLGRPLPNARTYVLDPWLRPVPVGVPGELYVAGGGVARGYLGRPAATAAVFLPDPFADAPGGRMYRTGDRVRRLPCGSIEFLGRTDDQVKVRGYRVEPGEVAAALRLHPAVRDAVVVVHRDGGEARLAAYVVGAGTEAPGADELREHLRAQLTEAMLPGCYVAIPALPLTANGKVDRRALPPPAWSDEAPRRSAPPQTPVQEVVAGVWAELLGADEVGVDDDFFALGGHSLLATRAISRVRQALGVDVPVRALFDAPVLAAFAARVEAMRRSSSPRQEAPLVPVGRQGPLPLSFAQQRLWFIEQVEPAGSLYHMPAVLRLRGALDAAALGRALDDLVARHEALRTSFEASDGEPVQVVHPHAPFAVAMHDLRSLPAEEREAELRRLEWTISQEPFDLSAAPLFRATLVCVESDVHVLLLCMHHIVSDGWSGGVLFRELEALYGAFARGEPSPLPPLAVQYADYAVWQRRLLDDLAMAREAEWWRGRLAGAPAVLELPADRPRPHVRGTAGASLQAELPPTLAAALRDLARREGATTYMVLLSAFYALLSRYAGHTDLVVGTPVAGRTRPELDGVVGFFVNTLALRADLSGDPSFRALLARVREVTLSAFEHQELPFDRLVEALRPERSLSVTPVFQVMFAMSDGLAAAPSLPGLEVSAGGMGGTTAKFDLTLAVSRRGNELRAVLEYGTELFDAGTVERMAAHYRTLLEGALADPGLPLSRLPLLEEAERERLLVEWTGARAPYPDRCIHSLFETQARRTPDRVAVRMEDDALTYAELDARANQLAHALGALGVGPETRVALCVERAPEMIVALLGMLKAGGAYVPLDPEYPAERLAYLLRDSRAAVLLTQERLAARLPAHGAALLCLDRDWDERVAVHPATPPDSGVRPENLAYVIYTSGSTGLPKGVLVEHRQLVDYTHSAIRRYAVTAADRVLQFVSLSFDACAEEIYPALLSGAELVLRTERMMDGMPLFLATCARWGITVLDLPTAYWHELVQELEETDAHLPPSVRLVLIGGERALPERLAAWQRRVGARARLMNAYGPTEATVLATVADLTRAEPVPLRPGEPLPPVAIGRPRVNTRAYVLDGRGGLLPAGARGELYLAGGGVARGYLGRASLTAERFLPDPFACEPGARMYRTGDLVRWRGDGELEFHGRADEQVKVRGYRVEPGEIEAVLRRQPGVRDAVVLAREDEPGHVRLVAWVVAADGAPGADVVAGLRDRLRADLPEYMVPAALVPLDALPLTAAGKLDRRALPAPAADDHQAYVAPRTATEKALAAIWAELLGTARVGAHDNFFHLGGHSLLATRLVSRIRAELSAEVTVRDLFQAPTPTELARVVERVRGKRPRNFSPLVRLKRGRADIPLFLVHPVGGGVSHYQPLVRHLPPGQRVYGLQAYGIEGRSRPLSDLQEMASAYLARIRRVRASGPVALAGWSLGGLIAFEMARQLQAAGRPPCWVGLIDSRAPLPGVYAFDPDAYDALPALAGDLARLTGRPATLPAASELAGLDAPERRSRVLRALEAAGVVGEHFPATEVERRLEVSRSALVAASRYAAGRVDLPITLFRAAERPHGGAPPSAAEWAALSSGPVEEVHVPGDHYSIFQAPHVKILARHVRERLEGAAQ